jgi:hypothetical protein
MIIYNTPVHSQEQKIATLGYVLNWTQGAYITDNKRLKEMDSIKIITLNKELYS